MAVGDPPKVGCDKIEHPYFMIEAPVSEDTPPQTDETRQLAAALKRLRILAGNPSLRAISARIERTDVYRSRSHNTVANLLNMKRLPTRWETVEAVVQALGGDVDEFKRLWTVAFAAEIQTKRSDVREAGHDSSGSCSDGSTAERGDEVVQRLQWSDKQQEIVGSACTDRDSFGPEHDNGDLAVVGPSSPDGVADLEAQVEQLRAEVDRLARAVERNAQIASVSNADTGRRRLTDELFLLAHDGRGKPRCDRRVLGIGLAVAVLAELVLDGQLALEGKTIRVREVRNGRGHAGVGEVVVRSIGSAESARTPAAWAWELADPVYLGVALGLIDAQCVRLAVTMWPGDRYVPDRQLAEAVLQRVQVPLHQTAMGNDILAEIDGQTKLLLALVRVLDLDREWIPRRCRREVSHRTELMIEALSVELRTLLSCVDSGRARLVAVPRR